MHVCKNCTANFGNYNGSLHGLVFGNYNGSLHGLVPSYVDCLLLYTYCFLQVLLNMIEYRMDPQAALDAPRFCIGPSRPDANSIILLEEGLSVDTVAQLRSLGHTVDHPVVGYDRAVFGRGQIIRQLVKSTSRGSRENDGGDMVRVWCGGSDGRGDGAAIGY